MRYCSSCGSDLQLKIPEGDNRERHVCGSCGAIHYRNPRVVTGCLATWQGRVLLCRRSIEPRKGFWTLPAGFLENGESASEGAVRETREEACARVGIRQLYAVFSLPHIDQVYMLFLGDLRDGRFSAGDESLEARLFGLDEIPWDELAFQSISETLRYYVEDTAANGGQRDSYPCRSGTIELLDAETRSYRTRLL